MKEVNIFIIIRELTGLTTTRASVMDSNKVELMNLTNVRESDTGILYANNTTNSYIVYHKAVESYYAFRLNA